MNLLCHCKKFTNNHKSPKKIISHEFTIKQMIVKWWQYQEAQNLKNNSKHTVYISKNQFFLIFFKEV